jgi:uncharacterized protein (TIGR02231 family)
MNHLKIALLVCFLLTGRLFAIEIDMVTKVDAVTIYHSGALVERTSAIVLKPGLNELVFKNLSSKIVLNSLKVANKEVTILNRTILRKLTKEEFDQLVDQKDALNKQMALIESKFSEIGFIKEVGDLTQMTDFYSKNILQLKKDLREVERQIAEAKKLEDIQIDNEDAAILKLVVSVDGKLKDDFKMQYVCGGIGWGPAYEMIVESSGDKTIEVKYMAQVMSQTGENWDDVSVNLSSSFPLESPTDLPKAKTPWVISGNNFYNENDNVNEKDNSKDIDRLDGIEYVDINIPSFLKQRTLKDKFSIKSNSTIFTFPIQTVKLPANYYYYGFPSLDPDVYLVAEITGWDTLNFIDGIANITFEGNEVGKSVIRYSEALDTLMLPVGKDNSVYMKRTEIADQKYFKVTTVGKKQKSTLAYKFELKNNNPFPIKFELLDQVPISQTKSAEVELGNISGATLVKDIGELTWMLDLKPGQLEEKELIFTVEMESESKNTGFHYYRSTYKRKYRTRSIPKYYN